MKKHSRTIHLAGLLTLLFIVVPVAVSAGTVQHLDQAAWEAIHGEALETGTLFGNRIPLPYSTYAPEEIKPRKKPVPCKIPVNLGVVEGEVCGCGGR